MHLKTFSEKLMINDNSLSGNFRMSPTSAPWCLLNSVMYEVTSITAYVISLLVIPNHSDRHEEKKHFSVLPFSIKIMSSEMKRESDKKKNNKIFHCAAFSHKFCHSFTATASIRHEECHFHIKKNPTNAFIKHFSH